MRRERRLDYHSKRRKPLFLASADRRSQGTWFRRLGVAKDEDRGPRWIEMPSVPEDTGTAVEPGQDYHDLGVRYPDAPVSRGVGDAIVHRAVLDDITGVPMVMDWVSDGDLVIVEMSRLLSRELELQTAVERIRCFVEDDLSGEVVRLGDSRLLLLPVNFKSTRKSEDRPLYL